MQVDLQVWLVAREDVERGHVAPYVDFIRGIAEDRNLLLQSRNRVQMQIAGYDSDPRELWEINEVRAFIRSLDHAVPFWLHLQPKVGLEPLLPALCLVDVKRRGVGSTLELDFSRDALTAMLQHHVDAVDELYVAHKYSYYEYDRFAADLIKYLSSVPFLLTTEEWPLLLRDDDTRFGPPLLYPIDPKQVNVRCVMLPDYMVQFNLPIAELKILATRAPDDMMNRGQQRQAIVDMILSGAARDERQDILHSCITSYLLPAFHTDDAGIPVNWLELQISPNDDGQPNFNTISRRVF